MLFAITAIDKPNSLSLRLSVREQHLAFARTGGKLRLGGPYLDAKGDMCGSLMIIEAADLDDARAWHAGDPYVKAGLFASSDVRPWKLIVNVLEAKS